MTALTVLTRVRTVLIDEIFGFAEPVIRAVATQDEATAWPATIDFLKEGNTDHSRQADAKDRRVPRGTTAPPA